MEWVPLDVVSFLRSQRLPVDPTAEHITNHEGVPVDGRLLLQDGPELLLSWMGKYDPETRGAVKNAQTVVAVMCVCVYINVCVCKCIYMCVCLQACVRPKIQVFDVPLYAYSNVCKYLCIRTHARTHVRTSTRKSSSELQCDKNYDAYTCSCTAFL